MPPKKKPGHLGTYSPVNGEGKGALFLYDAVRESPAYRVLKPSEKLVLFEMFRTYGRVSHFDTVNISKVGFPFTWAVCLEDVAEAAFSRARTRIIEVGFFDVPQELQILKPGSPNRYAPSQKWRDYEPTDAEFQRLKSRGRSKSDRLERDTRRRTDFLAKSHIKKPKRVRINKKSMPK